MRFLFLDNQFIKSDTTRNNKLLNLCPLQKNTPSGHGFTLERCVDFMHRFQDAKHQGTQWSFVEKKHRNPIAKPPRDAARHQGQIKHQKFKYQGYAANASPPNPAKRKISLRPLRLCATQSNISSCRRPILPSS
jgi:hypothetical protein